VREARKLNRALRAAAARADADVRRIRALIQPAPPAPPSSDDPPDNDDANAGALAFLTAGRGAEQLGIAPSLLLPEWAGDGATAAAEVGPLETNASFALSQLPALRDLLRQLRPRLEALSADESTREAAPPPADESAAARERRLYVEAQATRAVRRRLRGGALDGDGGGEAASTEGAGRAVSLEELAALEALVEEFNRPGDDAMEA
jgi:kinetochore protein Mis12/MTW1